MAEGGEGSIQHAAQPFKILLLPPLVSCLATQSLTFLELQAIMLLWMGFQVDSQISGLSTWQDFNVSMFGWGYRSVLENSYCI